MKFIPTVLLIALIGATPLLAATEAPADGRYAAIFPPGWVARDIMLAAAESGQPALRFGRTENIGIFVLSSAADRRALRNAGAWLILPANAFRGCLIEPPNRTPLANTNTESDLS